CSTKTRPVEGSLTYNDGMVSGTLSFAEEDIADGPITFEVTGVHNPTTGGLTLSPGLWTQTDDVTPAYNTFWWDGVYNANDRILIGDSRNNAPGCIPGQVMLSFD
ncbi:MAG: hypothetical protein ACPG77_06240, partial [Nannocystaceae bacterium]